jgi:biopolymer transport protein TolR
MAGGQFDDDEEITGINVTPLVDIVLVLLIIFMVTANFIVRETVEVDLPRAANTQDKTVQGPVMVTMDKDAKLFLDGVETLEPELVAKMKAAVAKDKDVRAIISADQALNYGKVMGLIDLVKEAGIGKFALNIQKEAKAAAAGTTP